MIKTVLGVALLLQSALAFAGNVSPIREIFEPAGNFPKEDFVKIAVVAWTPKVDAPVPATIEQAEAYKHANRQEFAAFAREAARKGAEIIVTTEFGITGYPVDSDNFLSREQVKPYLETVPGITTGFFGNLSRELGVFIQVSFAERDLKSDRYYNAAVVMDPHGQIAAHYRKQNLYGMENRFLSPGTEPKTFNSPAGKLGVMICADVYDYDVLRQYKDLDVDGILLSVAWAAGYGVGSFRSGAKFLDVPLAASNQMYQPDSGVFNPDGSEQSHIRQSSGIAYGYMPRK